MASEILRVDNQETLEALQREADELKKKLEDEKAKLKDVESNYADGVRYVEMIMSQFPLVADN